MKHVTYNKSIILLFALIVSFLFLIFDIQAMGLSVDPARLAGETRKNDKISFVLVVYNDTKEPGIYDVYADNFSDWFEVRPAQFRLHPGERQKVNIDVMPEKSGGMVTNISVVSRSLNRKSFNAASGLKIPLTLEVIDNSLVVGFWHYMVIVILIILILSLLLVIYYKKRSLWRRTISRTEDGIDWLLHHNEKWYHKLIRRIKRKI